MALSYIDPGQTEAFPLQGVPVDPFETLPSEPATDEAFQPFNVSAYALDQTVCVDSVVATQFGLDPALADLDTPSVDSTPQAQERIFSQDRPYFSSEPVTSTRLGLTIEDARAAMATAHIDAETRALAADCARLTNPVYTRMLGHEAMQLLQIDALLVSPYARDTLEAIAQAASLL